MKFHHILVGAGLLGLWVPYSSGAGIIVDLPGNIEVVQTIDQIQVCGVINGGIIGPNAKGDTMDYLKFEVLTTSVVTFRMQNYGGNLHLLGSFIGRDDAFGFVDSPFYLWVFAGHDFNGPLPSFTRTLEAGTYVMATGQDSHSGYDIFDGFRAVNPEGGGGGFIFGNYAYDILGDVRALEFWDGDLDGTFTITRFPVPEPGFGYLLLVTTLTAVGRRRRVRP